MRYKLRTLLIVLALGPPVLAGLWLADRPVRELLAALACLAIPIAIALLFVVAVVDRSKYRP
jgi:hypothetical protein